MPELLKPFLPVENRVMPILRSLDFHLRILKLLTSPTSWNLRVPTLPTQTRNWIKTCRNSKIVLNLEIETQILRQQSFPLNFYLYHWSINLNIKSLMKWQKSIWKLKIWRIWRILAISIVLIREFLDFNDRSKLWQEKQIWQISTLKTANSAQ